MFAHFVYDTMKLRSVTQKYFMKEDNTMKMIEKALYLGLGVFSVTRERVEKVVNELMDKGEISREEAGEVIEDLIKRGEEERKAIRNLVQEEMGGLKKDLSTSTQSELEELKARIRELEKRLEQS